MPKIRTFSVLEKLRANLGRAEGNLKRAQTRLDDLRARYALAEDHQKPGLEKRGHMARLEVRDAEAWVASARDMPRTEEQRLMQPDTFLRYE